MKLALFDLDNTLVAGDSDALWTEFLIDEGILSEADRELSEGFNRDYQQGRLDVQRFVEFHLRPFREHPLEKLLAWRERYFETRVLPAIPRAARDLVRGHQRLRHVTVIITATNNFTTAPVARELEVDALLATELEQNNGSFTGRLKGTPCFREGKIIHLKRWIATRETPPDETWFYSDSINDVPLLESVDHPTAVDPDHQLLQVAHEKGWPVISLRG